MIVFVKNKIPLSGWVAMSTYENLCNSLHSEVVLRIIFDSTKEKGSSHEIVSLTMVTGGQKLVLSYIGQFTTIPASCNISFLYSTPYSCPSPDLGRRTCCISMIFCESFLELYTGMCMLRPHIV